MPTVGVFATVFDEAGRVMLVRINYGSGNWVLPGGHLEKHESPEDGVKREVFEETGCDIKLTSFAGVYSAPEKDDLVLLFRAEIVKEGIFMPNDEIKEVGFFHRGSLPKQMHAWNVKRINDAYEGTESSLHIFRELEV